MERDLNLLEIEANRLLRPELRGILDKGKRINRFTGDDLPQDVVFDNVRDHILRCFDIAKSLAINQESQILLQKMILIHDLPEIENLFRLNLTADITAPVKKSNPDLAREVEEKEELVAREIFSEDEYLLYKMFEDGSNYFKKPNLNKEFCEIGALAKLIDTVDPDLVLHRSLSEWAKTENYNPDILKSGMSLSYAFTHGISMMVYFNRASDSELRLTGLNLMDNHFKEIRMMWNLVTDLDIPLPDEIEEFL